MEERTLCSYCGKDCSGEKITVVRSSIDRNIFICRECIDLCEQMFKKHDSIKNGNKNKTDKSFKIPEIMPQKMKEEFDKYIVEQENAKKVLSVSIHNHLQRIKHNMKVKESKKGTLLKKSNILMVGPSGSGKTLLIETIARKLNIPYTIQDATALTQSGYVGEDPEIMLRNLIENADGDIKKAEMGIVFIDEIDKIGRKGENVSITRDVSGEGVQQALLKILEGSLINVPKSGTRKNPMQECYQINTSDILFICGGAFENIERIIERRLSKRRIGFQSDSMADLSDVPIYNRYISQISAKDLIQFGMMPELIGRLPMICTLTELDRNSLIRILTEPEDSIIEQYRILFKESEVNVEFEESALEFIADEAIRQGTGARGLRNIIDCYMLDYMFKLNQFKHKTIIFTRNNISQFKY